MGQWWSGRRRGSTSDAPSASQTAVSVEIFLMVVAEQAVGEQHCQTPR